MSKAADASIRHPVRRSMKPRLSKQVVSRLADSVSSVRHHPIISLVGVTAVALLSTLVPADLVSATMWPTTDNPAAVRLHFARFERIAELATYGWALGALALLGLIAVCLTVAFDMKLPRRSRLLVVVAAYACVTLSFGGVYYAMAVFADYKDSIETLSAITSARAIEGVHTGERWLGLPESQLVSRQARNLRAFSGLPRLYSEQEKGVGVVDTWTRVMVMGDCLHYSLVTISTTGFGDIVPRLWYATLATDLEIVLGIVLLVVALNASR